MKEKQEKYLYGNAVFSSDGKHRYFLIRQWKPEMNPRYLLYLGLNPSKANAREDDMTVIKCVGFADRLGFGTMAIVNMYSYIETDSEALFTMNPFKLNDEASDRWLTNAASNAAYIVYAFGKGNTVGFHQRRFDVDVILSGVEKYCLGYTKTGYPRHPSRLGYNIQLEHYVNRITPYGVLPPLASNGR